MRELAKVAHLARLHFHTLPRFGAKTMTSFYDRRHGNSLPAA